MQSSTSRFLSGYLDDKEINGISHLGDLLIKKKQNGVEAATDSEIEALTAKLLPEQLLRIRNVTDAEAIAHLVDNGWKGNVLAYVKYGADPEEFADGVSNVRKIVRKENLKIVFELDASDPATKEPIPAADPVYPEFESVLRTPLPTLVSPWSYADPYFAGHRSLFSAYPFVPLYASGQFTPYSAFVPAASLAPPPPFETGANPAKRPKVETSTDTTSGGQPTAEDLRTLNQEVKSLRDLVQQPPIRQPSSDERIRKLVHELILEVYGRPAKRPKVEATTTDTSTGGQPAAEDLRELICEVRSLRDLIQQHPTCQPSAEDLRKLVREVIRDESGRNALVQQPHTGQPSAERS